MLLILEGLDKCGKTTFANKFLGLATVIHCTKDSDCTKVLLDAAKMADSGKLVILDRSFLSEMCYGPVYRGTMDITPAKFMRIAHALKKTEHAILYFSRPEGSKKKYDKTDELR